MDTAPCSPCIEGLHRGAWTTKEDMILSDYIRIHGDSGGWKNLPQKAGLKRSGKSCRLRWLNYLRPDIKRGNISPDEEELIFRLHSLLGNRWSLIAGRLPGRTDNEIKNYWNTHLSKKMLSMNESQRSSRSQNLKKRSKSPSPLQNHVFKATPVKFTMAVRHSEMVKPVGFNGYECSNYRMSDEAFKLCNVKEISTERIASEMGAGINVVEADSARNSAACSMLSLADEESPHSDYFAAGDAAALAESLLDMNELLSSDWSLLFSPISDCSTDFGLEEFYRRSATEMNEFEDIMCTSEQSNMQRANSLSVSDHEEME